MWKIEVLNPCYCIGNSVIASVFRSSVMVLEGNPVKKNFKMVLCKNCNQLGEQVKLSCVSPRPWILCSWTSPSLPGRASHKQCAIRPGQGDHHPDTMHLCNETSINPKLQSRYTSDYLMCFYIE